MPYLADEKRYDAYCEPKPDPIPPIIVGGGGNKTTLLAAHYAEWWSIPDANIEVFKDPVTVLKDHCANIGRDPDSLQSTWFGRMAVSHSEAEAEALSEGEWTKERALVGTPAQVVEQLQQFCELGVDYFMVEVLVLSKPDLRRMVLEEGLPKANRY